MVLRVQNIYGDGLRAFKIFLDKVTRQTLNKISWDFGAKPLDYYYLMQGEDGEGHESFEYPNCLVSVEDIQPVDNVGPIARNAGMNVHFSPHQVMIAENITRDERIIMDKRWMNLMFTVVINVEDVTSMLNYYDLFIGYMPMQYFFYDYKFYTYIEVTPFCEHWNFDTDTIKNVSIRPDATYRYEPEVYYEESPEVTDPSLSPEDEKFNSHLSTQTRDRELGRDIDTVREGYRYFATVEMEPILKLQSIQKQTDKASQKHSIQKEGWFRSTSRNVVKR